MKGRKNRKFTFRSFMKNLREAVAKSALNVIVIAIFLVITFMLGKAYLYRSDYFKLRRVEIKETFLDQKSLIAIKSRILSSYKMKSIFELNLKSMAQVIQNTYPDAKDVVLTLALPDKLMVSLKMRRPVALVKADKLYPVDEEGVILPITDPAALKWIPTVEGVQIRPDDRKTKFISSKNLRVAIDLLRKIKDIKLVADFGVDSVDARDLGNISFCLRSGVEIRIGSDNFKDRLMTLAKTFRDSRLIMERIKYIDLRFGDAVIGPK